MSMHKKPLTPLERAGLEAHALDIGAPSQLSDAFRQGVAFAIAANAPVEPELVNFNEDYALPAWEKAPGYAGKVSVGFDGAEGGAVWVSDDKLDEMIAIRGPEACRELARLLLAFADGYANEA